MGPCPKCGAAVAADHAFCGECGLPLTRGGGPADRRPPEAGASAEGGRPRVKGESALPVVLRHDRARLYDSGIETTLDLRLEGTIEDGS
ncbi:MAG: zinc ribbon domain-containing protein, partial [Planctomycetes bacterium]|nr:zinc ribbon domain-containing protein [Planctomycetota bacterium]